MIRKQPGQMAFRGMQATIEDRKLASAKPQRDAATAPLFRTPSPVVQAALEWFRASGERTAERLEALVQHFGEINAYDDSMIDTLQQEARRLAGFDP